MIRGIVEQTDLTRTQAEEAVEAILYEIKNASLHLSRPVAASNLVVHSKSYSLATTALQPVEYKR